MVYSSKFSRSSIKKLFSFQLDVATDINKDEHSIAHVRFCYDTLAVEELLFCKPVKFKSNTLIFFDILNDFINEGNLRVQNHSNARGASYNLKIAALQDFAMLFFHNFFEKCIPLF